MSMPVAKTPMFRGLRLRMTLLNAGTTVFVILVIRLLTAWWLSAQFTAAADTALTQKLTQALVTHDLPIPAGMHPDATTPILQDERRLLDAFLPTDTPALMIDMLTAPGTINTYLILANSDGIPLRETNVIPPYPLQYDSLLAASDHPQFRDSRTVTDANGNAIRIMSLVIPNNPIRYIQVGRPLADYVALEAQLRWILLWGGILGIAVVITTAWILSGVFVKPAAEAYEQQRRFITNASHELRTPLSIVRASAQIAQLDLPAGSPIAELLDTIVAENRHMTNTIENLLTIARTQDTIAPVSAYLLSTLLHDTAEAARRTAPHRSITVFDCADTLTCQSDPHYVGHIVRILLDNAIAHTPDEAAISISCNVSGTGREIRVTDTGPGIPPAHVGAIFEPFVSYARGTGHRGSGIGLNIAATFAAALRATLRYEANTPHGACFVLRLPL